VVALLSCSISTILTISIDMKKKKHQISLSAARKIRIGKRSEIKPDGHIHKKVCRSSKLTQHT
jgi:hypothetical protein